MTAPETDDRVPEPGVKLPGSARQAYQMPQILSRLPRTQLGSALPARVECVGHFRQAAPMAPPQHLQQDFVA